MNDNLITLMRCFKEFKWRISMVLEHRNHSY